MESSRVYDDSVIFINRTDLSKDEYINVLMLLNKIVLRIVLICGFILMALGGITLAINLSDGYVEKMDIITISGGVFFVLFYFLFLAFLKSKFKKTLTPRKYEVLFYDDKINVLLTSETFNANEIKYYSEIKKCMVTNEYILLFINRAAAYVMKKDVNAERIVDFVRGKNIKIINKSR